SPIHTLPLPYALPTLDWERPGNPAAVWLPSGPPSPRSAGCPRDRNRERDHGGSRGQLSAPQPPHRRGGEVHGGGGRVLVAFASSFGRAHVCTPVTLGR